MAKTKFIYLYVDNDSNVFEVFDDLEKAKAFAEERCPSSSYGGEIYPQWEDGDESWGWGEYIHIYKRKVK